MVRLAALLMAIVFFAASRLAGVADATDKPPCSERRRISLEVQQELSSARASVGWA